MDMGITAAKFQYRRTLLNIRASTMTVVPAFRALTKASKKAGKAGLAEGNLFHMLDVATLLSKTRGMACLRPRSSGASAHAIHTIMTTSLITAWKVFTNKLAVYEVYPN